MSSEIAEEDGPDAVSDFDGDGRVCWPTDTLPGSQARVAVYERRAARGQHIFHPQDAILPDDVGFLPKILNVEASEMEVERAAVYADGDGTMSTIEAAQHKKVKSRKRRRCEEEITTVDRFREKLRKRDARAKQAALRDDQTRAS